MLRLAVVGTSRITEQFTAACRLTGRYEFAGVYSRSRETGEAFARKNGFSRVYTDLTELARDPAIDAVYIASPNACHVPQSRLLLQYGKHVLCEKPVVTNSEELKELLGLAKKNRLIFSEAIMSRHSPGRRPLKEAVAKIGRISQVRLDFCQLTSRYEALTRGEQVNIFDMSLAAGTLMDLGVYCVYAAADLFGLPEEITASASFLPNRADSSGAAVFRYQNFTAVLSYSKLGQSALGSEIIGDRGTVRLAGVSQYVGVSLIQNGTQTPIFGDPGRAEIMRGECRYFADCIEHSEALQEEYTDASRLSLTVHRCMDAIKQSAGIQYPIKNRSEYL